MKQIFTQENTSVNLYPGLLFKCNYDKNCIFAIEAILKHKQVSRMRTKNAVYYFEISISAPEIFKFFQICIFGK